MKAIVEHKSQLLLTLFLTLIFKYNATKHANKTLLKQLL